MSADRLIRFEGKLREFPALPFTLRNSLPGHPLFDNDRIKRLLRTVPHHDIEIRLVTTRAAPDHRYRRGVKLDDLDPVEAFERLEERSTWMLVHNSWKHDRDYGELVRAYVAELTGQCAEMEREVYDIGCWLFLSSGGGVVHFHADPDQSVLNEIRGSKTVYTYPARILPETTIENLVHTHDQGVVTYSPDYESALNPPVVLNPGDSVFLPLYAPHRVINDAQPCVALNVGFNTRKSLRRRRIHLVNRELRAHGVAVTPYDRHRVRDTLKHLAYFGLWLKQRLVRVMHLEHTATV